VEAGPRIYVDFNYWGALDSPRGSLDHFTRLPGEGLEDLARQGLKPTEGLRVVLYDHDAMEDGSPAYLENEGVLFWDEDRAEWLAAFARAGFRWEPRSE
jgi:hypothetical protein